MIEVHATKLHSLLFRAAAQERFRLRALVAIVSLSLLFAALLPLPQPMGIRLASARPVSTSGAKRLLQIKGLLAQIKINPKWARGRVGKAEFSAAADHQIASQKLSGRAVKLWNSLGMWDKRAPQARPVVAELKAKSTYLNRLADVLGAMQTKRGARSAGPGAPPPPPANLSSASRHFIKNFDANYGRLRADPRYCAGDFSGGQHRAALDLQMRIARSQNFTMTAAKRVPGNERRIGAVKFRLDRFAKLLACNRAISARSKQLKAGSAVTKRRYFAFMKDARPYNATVRALIGMLQGGSQRDSNNADELKKWMADLDALHALCTGKYVGIENDGRYGFQPVKNPEKWCELAAKRKNIGQQLVGNSMARQLRIVIARLKDTTADLVRREGYITADGQFAQDCMYRMNKVKKEFNNRFGPLLAAAGMRKPANIYKPLIDVVAAFWAEVDRLAPTLKSPQSAGGGQPVKAVRAHLRGSKIGKILKAYTTRKSWKIHKSALGIPLRRTRPGYVQYKSKTRNKWCESRGFTYTEKRTRHGYAKSKGVILGYVRYMRCGK